MKTAIIPVLVWPFALTSLPGLALAEEPAPLPAEQAVPAALWPDIEQTVGDPVDNDGMHNRYRLESTIGSFSVTTTHGLCKLHGEIDAIAEMAKLEGTAAFSDAAVDAAKDLGRGAKRLVTDPAAALGGAAKGLGKAFRRFGERVTRGDESSKFEDDSLEQVIGFSKIKREQAFLFGVDVYSNNERLQEYLDQISWARYSGSVGFSVAAAVATGGVAGAALSVTSYTQVLEEVIRDSSPTDLRTQTRETLEAMRINRDLIDLFIRNDNLSPRHQTFIAGALKTIDGAAGKDHLLRAAARADSYEEGSDRQIQAQLFAAVHAEHPIVRFEALDNLLIGKTASGDIHVAAVVDFLYWTDSLDALASDVDAGLGDGEFDKHLWLLGGLSELAQTNFTALGWQVHTNQLERAAPGLCQPTAAELTVEDT